MRQEQEVEDEEEDTIVPLYVKGVALRDNVLDKPIKELCAVLDIEVLVGREL